MPRCPPLVSASALTIRDRWFDDNIALIRPWGFELSSTSVPVAVWQDPHDRVAHGEWLAGHIPTPRPRVEPEHGHLSLAVGSLARILDDLIGQA